MRAGADGLVLFNRYYAPDIDLTTLKMTRSLPLSTKAELPLSLVWIGLLSRRVACSLAASRGVETEVEVVKYLLAGADVVMTTSALLRHGPEHLGVMRDGLARWLAENRFESVEAIRGLKDASRVADVDAFLRAQYVAALTDYLPGKLVQCAGADGLVLFNRYYAPDIDLTTLKMTRSLPLSTKAELPLSLVWIGLLSRRVPCSLAASRGVETEVEVVKYLLAGANVVMTTSALLRHGPQHLGVMRDGLARWLAENRFESVEAIRGLKDASRVADVDAFLRAQYVAALTDYAPGKLVQ